MSFLCRDYCGFSYLCSFERNVEEAKEYKESYFENTINSDNKVHNDIADDGTVKGIDNPQECCLEIENKINDSFKPIPEYSLSIDAKTNVITLCVKEGIDKPYLYKAKSYKRNDSATVELDPLELKRLIMAGMNLTFEELPSAIQEPKFSYLDEKLKMISI